MAMSPWVEDVASYAGAGATGLAMAYAVDSVKDPKDAKRILYALVPAVAGGIGAAFLTGVAASLAEGVALGGVASLGWVLKPFLSSPSSQPSPGGYRVPTAWRYPVTGYVAPSLGAGRGVIEI